MNNNFINNDLLTNKYLNCPFPHIIIDNFLNDEILKIITNYSKSIKLENYNFKKLPPNKNCEYKYANTKIDSYPDNIKQLFEYLNSNEFINKLEKLTGIKNIISNNTNLFGAGFHKITNKGFLNLHTDFNNYNDPINGSLDRRINLLIYLNDNWKDEYNGHLLLCDKNNNSITHKISPILNRCVIFNTTSYSIHGHPDRLNVPDNISRDSLSLYYYTKNINGDTCFEGNEFHCTKYYKKSLFN